jgi:sigma-E factor negative regulatory protein RseC
VSPDLHTVEGIARVVGVEGSLAWLEPEQTGGCGSCASSSSCGAKGIGTVASRMEARRFPLDNVGDLRVGERVVVGVGDRALIKASLTAYALPLATALGAGGVAEWAMGSDLMTMVAMAAGLFAGILAASIGAGRLSARGDLSPHFLRRAKPDETCGTSGEPT